MTRSRQSFRKAALAGLALSAVSLLQASAQSNMPVPRYQSPGVSAPQAPAPQVNFPVTPAITPNGAVAEEVIVRVNDQIISRSDLDRGSRFCRENWRRQAQALPMPRNGRKTCCAT